MQAAAAGVQYCAFAAGISPLEQQHAGLPHQLVPLLQLTPKQSDEIGSNDARPMCALCVPISPDSCRARPYMGKPMRSS